MTAIYTYSIIFLGCCSIYLLGYFKGSKVGKEAKYGVPKMENPSPVPTRPFIYDDCNRINNRQIDVVKSGNSPIPIYKPE
jgi:hypothetical protein